jgi:hypothetical protein
MSMDAIERLLGGFPAALRDPVLGYAVSVKGALPEIFREARIDPDPVLEDQVVFIAGIRKLHAMVSSTFWTLNKALRQLGTRDIPSVRIGARGYSLDSVEYRRIEALYDSLRTRLEEENLLRFMRGISYAAVLQTLDNERRERS